MAHVLCPNGHSMWDGDGKPIVYVFRIVYIKEFCKNNPNIRFESYGKYTQMYDITDNVEGEDIDCWYCDECKGINVYVDNRIYQYKRINGSIDINITEIMNLDEYIALRNDEYEKFQKYYNNMKPIEAIDAYDFKYRYKISKDKQYIYAINKNNTIEFGYELSYSNENE